MKNLFPLRCRLFLLPNCVSRTLLIFAYYTILHFPRSRSLHDDFFQPRNAEIRISRLEISNSSQIWIWISMETDDNDFVTKRGLLTLGTWVYIEIWRFFPLPPFFFYFNRNAETSIRIEIKRRSPSFDLNTQKFS